VVQTFEEVLQDEQAVASGAFVSPPGLQYKLVAAPFSFSCSDGHTPTRGAPAVGEHNQQVMRELGYSAEQVDRMVESEVVSTTSKVIKRLT
jgi:formyl-CoA transferase